MGADIMNFNIKDIWLSSNTQYPIPYTQITLKPNDTLNVQISFTPDKERTYNAYIEYETSIGTEYSYLMGGGKVLRTIAEIPKYWSDQHIELIPGQRKDIEFKFIKNYNETKDILDGNITSFTAKIFFNMNANQINVYPDIKSCTDIIQSGTMTEGWSCDEARFVDKYTLQVKMSGSTPLKATAGDVLFKFSLNTYISSITDNPISIPCDLKLINRPYILIDTIPGDIKITPLCVNKLRLVEISSIPYTMSEPMPNPASSSSTLDYSIAFEGKTTFELYDSFGNRLAEVFNENLQSGSYRLTLNTDALHLSSGIYFIRMESGAYSETKKVVVVK
jgi:hypothetical protein